MYIYKPKKEFPDRLFAIIFVLAVMGIVWGMWEVATFDYCPWYYQIECF